MLDNLHRLVDYNVRYGETPGDGLVQIVYVASLDESSNVISTHFAPGTKVAVVPYVMAEVAADGTLDLAVNPEPEADDEGGYLLIGKGYQISSPR